uniref:Uncharacterized protein n=1 Tax=Arundo donax TaxID=35708 RepID=A0A0A8Y5Z3_ARUDO
MGSSFQQWVRGSPTSAALVACGHVFGDISRKPWPPSEAR